jgi:hypothetical protein
VGGVKRHGTPNTGDELRQRVVIHRVADRHADLHGREFGGAVHTAPTTGDVLVALRALGIFPPTLPGSWSITIDWPHDSEGAQAEEQMDHNTPNTGRQARA